MSNRPATRKAPAKKAAPKGLRAALAAKKVRLAHYDIPQVDSDVADEVAARVRRAQSMLSVLDLGDDGDAQARAEAERELAEAKARLAECFHRVSFKGLPEDDFDALVNEHPPTPEQVDKDKKLPKDQQRLWNEDTFVPALAEACYVGGDGLTAEEWDAELRSWPRAEAGAFVRVLMDANRRDFSDGIPKD
jgi:hypothetical protein